MEGESSSGRGGRVAQKVSAVDEVNVNSASCSKRLEKKGGNIQRKLPINKQLHRRLVGVGMECVDALKLRLKNNARVERY